MNKSALRSFSAWARRYLIENIDDRAKFIGVTKDKVTPMQAKTANSFMVNGVTFEFSPQARDNFVEYIRDIGYENAIEEIAYTWFNRIRSIKKYISCYFVEKYWNNFKSEKSSKNNSCWPTS